MGLDTLVGLTNLKKQARRDIIASKITREPFPHTLISSVGGTGKTAVARACAEDLGYHFIEREAASMNSRSQIIYLLTEADHEAKQKGKLLLLFVDEVHRLSLVLQEVFYYPMKEWRVTTKTGMIQFNPFCLFAATTRRDMLDEASFVARFPNKWDIDRYHWTHLKLIVSQYFDKEGIQCNQMELEMIARRCLGIPRQAINLGLKIRNEVLFRGGSRTVTVQDIMTTFQLERIDSIGLTELHTQYLLSLASAGVPKGLSSLAGSLGQHQDVISGSIEPTLLSLNMISMEPRGRVLTEVGRKHLEVV